MSAVLFEVALERVPAAVEHDYECIAARRQKGVDTLSGPQQLARQMEGSA